MTPSIFLDFNLPNAATWFYFSLMLSVALFLQFARPLSLRNGDLLALFLLTPGFLFLQEAHAGLARLPAGATGPDADALKDAFEGRVLAGYVWLLAASAFWFVRSVVDLALVRRPAVTSNLNSAGLAWFGFALFVGLTAVAVRPAPPAGPADEVGKRPEAIARVQDGATAAVQLARVGNGSTATPEVVRFWVERGLALGCHFAVVLALVFIGGKHFGDWTAGAAMATLYLLLPYTALNIGQLHHVWPSAFVTWAVFAYRRPRVSGLLLGLAAGSAFVPLLLFPVWMAFYSRRGSFRFALFFALGAAASLGVTGFALYIDGQFAHSLNAALGQSDWQPWKVPVTESIWTGTHWAYRLPVFVLFVAFLVGGVFWPSPKNLAHLIALSAALLIGVQFWYADKGGVYVLWYLPLVLLAVFRPNLSALEPPPLEPTRGVVSRAVRAAGRRILGRAGRIGPVAAGVA